MSSALNSTTISTRRLTSALTMGAFALLSLSAQAQVAPNPYGAQRSGPATPNVAQTGAQKGAVAGRAANSGITYDRANTVLPSGRVNNANNYSNVYISSVSTGFGVSDFGGYGSYGSQASNTSGFNGLGGYNGNGLATVTSGGTQTGSNITVIASPYYGGFATFGADGTYSFGQPGGFAAFGPGGTYLFGQPGGYNSNGDPSYTGRNRGSVNSSSLPTAPTQPATPSLAQSLLVRRGQNFDVSIGWRGDPALISGLKVTLLDRYHLPVAQQSASASSAAYFPAGKDTYAARYYRVDVQYADGAVASLTAPLQR